MAGLLCCLWEVMVRLVLGVLKNWILESTLDTWNELLPWPWKVCLGSCSKKQEENRRQTQRTKSLFPPSALQSSFSKPLAKPNRELAGKGEMCFAESQPKHHKAECREVRGGVLYNKEYDWPLSLASGRKILSPWKFPSNRSVFVIQELLGSHLNLYYQDDSDGDWSPGWVTMGWED